MTFEEFFKKKRIDLVALDKSEPALFSEFKTHFGQMGEKSFDHTKKYWFNKIRRQFPLPLEVKTEKVHIENPVAEQTIIESLAEPQAASTPPPAKVGFVPKFKAANMPKPSVVSEEKREDISTPPAEENALPKPAYKPRFNMKNLPPKPPGS